MPSCIAAGFLFRIDTAKINIFFVTDTHLTGYYFFIDKVFIPWYVFVIRTNT